MIGRILAQIVWISLLFSFLFLEHTFLFLAYDHVTQLLNCTYLLECLSNSHTYVASSA